MQPHHMFLMCEESSILATSHVKEMSCRIKSRKCWQVCLLAETGSCTDGHLDSVLQFEAQIGDLERKAPVGPDTEETKADQQRCQLSAVVSAPSESGCRGQRSNTWSWQGWTWVWN